MPPAGRIGCHDRDTELTADGTTLPCQTDHDTMFDLYVSGSAQMVGRTTRRQGLYRLPAAVGVGQIVRTRLSHGAVSTVDARLDAAWRSAPAPRLEPWRSTIVVAVEGLSLLRSGDDRTQINSGYAYQCRNGPLGHDSHGGQRVRRVVFHLEQPVGPNGVVPLDDTALRLASELVHGPTDGLHRESNALLLLASLERLGNVADDLATHARRLLFERLETPPSLSSLAARVGLTPRTLNRRLRAKFGATAFELLTRERIRRARESLLATATPAGALGLSLGFASPSHFASTFKARTGVTPSVFRRRGTNTRTA